jgi:hypothetical protein
MQERTPAAEVTDRVDVVQAQSVQPFALATLPDIDLDLGHDKSDALEGHIDLEIVYGPSKGSLRYLFRYEGKPQIGIGQVPSLL